MAEKKDATARIHVGLVLAEIICWSAFIFEVKRALAGNTLSWAYVFEWPILGLYAIYMWRRLLKEERGQIVRKKDVSEVEDPQLTAWNDYLASVHQHDPGPDHGAERDNAAD